jgi:lipopolysaccharide transport system permease protein
MDATPAPFLRIEPTRGWRVDLRLQEIWKHRELLYFLVWRDIKLRYRQTVLGALWAVIQPVLPMVVFSIIFGRLAKLPSEGVPYPIFAYAALLPWCLFANALTQASNSLVVNQDLITKVYLPRLIIPLAATLPGLLDFAISFLVLVGMMFYYDIAPGPAMFALPLFVILVILTALSVGLWSSALNVRYRDVRHTIPFVMQFWMYCTPVVYSSTLVPERWRILYGLNPMVGVTDGFRWALLGRSDPPLLTLAVSVGIVLFLLLGGLIYFRRTEATFADVV